MMAAPAKKKSHTLANTPANRAEIVGIIESKLGPVGKGHHESHRKEHLMAWLKKKGSSAS